MIQLFDHLQSLVTAPASTTIVGVILQECVASDLESISNRSWVQKKFHLMDTDVSNWALGHYGTTILVD